MSSNEAPQNIILDNDIMVNTIRSPHSNRHVSKKTIYKQLREGKFTIKQLNKVLLGEYSNLIYNPFSKKIVSKKNFNTRYNKGHISLEEIKNITPYQNNSYKKALLMKIE